ncbi:antigen 2 [Diplonema papillatum]|nr:antigen 2 [Diplonema papillatum]
MMALEDNADLLADEHAVEQAKEYLRQGDTVEFFEVVASSLLKAKPANAVLHCLDLVRALKQGKPADSVSADPAARTEDAKYALCFLGCKFT